MEREVMAVFRAKVELEEPVEQPRYFAVDKEDLAEVAEQAGPAAVAVAAAVA